MSKYRKSFVTNSSSSSFVISRDAISRTKLIDVLLEIANEEAKYDEWLDDQRDNNGNAYNIDDDVIGNVVAHRYIINEIIGKGREDWFERGEENVYIIDNESCGRYDWEAIEDILAKHNIDWHMGYCD